MAKKTSEESVPVQELKPSTVVPLRRIMIILLASFCVFVGVLIYQIYPSDTEPVMQNNLASAQQKPVPPDTVKSSVVFRGIRQKPARPEPTPVEIEIPPAETPVEVPMAEPIVEPTKPEQPALTAPETPAPAVVETPAPAESSARPQTQENRLTLAEALRLRDALATGQPCSDEMRLIMKRTLPDEGLRDALIEHLMPVCSTTATWDELNKLFLKDKKEALMTYYRMTSSNRWVAYLKTVGTLVVDVRRLNPVKQKPKDMISMAQNALTARDVAGAVSQLNRLPAEIKADFSDFLALAGSYRLARTDAETLILSFAKKEEK